MRIDGRNANHFGKFTEPAQEAPALPCRTWIAGMGRNGPSCSQGSGAMGSPLP